MKPSNAYASLAASCAVFFLIFCESRPAFAQTANDPQNNGGQAIARPGGQEVYTRLKHQVEKIEKKQESLKLEVQQMTSQPAVQAKAEQDLAIVNHYLDQAKEKLATPPAIPAEQRVYVQSVSDYVKATAMATRDVQRDLGDSPASGMERIIDNLQNRGEFFSFGQGSPEANVGFDGARLRNKPEEFYQIGGNQSFSLPPPPITVWQATPSSIWDADKMVSEFGSIPGGVVLEGIASDLENVKQVAYDPIYNAFIFDDRTAYVIKSDILPETTALMCRVIAQDIDKKTGEPKARVGVSMGNFDLMTYGTLPVDSGLALDLFMTDNLLGEFVFAENNWSIGYKFEDGWMPKKLQGDSPDVAVCFEFYQYEFQTENDLVHLRKDGFHVELYPISAKKAEDGGSLPDDDAIARGCKFPEFEGNAKYLQNEKEYFLREPLIQRTFEYGELAAVIRGLKQAGIDLESLADEIENGGTH